MDRPERADYFRVFARHMLTDEDYEGLTRDEWGSVFLLMLHQWSKGGTLPADRRKLASIAKCSEAELDDLMTRWPKLQPVDGEEDRVGIPYLVREWQQVMGFYEDQTRRSALGVAARKSKGLPPDDPMDKPLGSPTGEPPDQPMGFPAVTHGSPKGSPNQDQDQDQDKKNGDAKASLVEKSGEPDHSTGPVGGGRPLEVVGAWNTMAEGTPLPKARLTPKRAREIQIRLREKGWLEDFGKACAFIRGAPWYHGQNDRGWIATLDYLLRPGKATELAEKSTTPTRAPQSRPGGPNGRPATHHRSQTDDAYRDFLLAEREQGGDPGGPEPCPLPGL